MTPWKRKFIVEKPWDQAICQMNKTEKNKMDNSQNGYSSVEKTGKIKKNIVSQQTEKNLT